MSMLLNIREIQLKIATKYHFTWVRMATNNKCWRGEEVKGTLLHWCWEWKLGTATVEDFPDNSVGKESACNVEDLDLIPGLGRSQGRRERREFHGLYSPWDRKELDTTEWLSLHFTVDVIILSVQVCKPYLFSCIFTLTLFVVVLNIYFNISNDINITNFSSTCKYNFENSRRGKACVSAYVFVYLFLSSFLVFQGSIFLSFSACL